VEGGGENLEGGAWGFPGVKGWEVLRQEGGGLAKGGLRKEKKAKTFCPGGVLDADE